MGELREKGFILLFNYIYYIYIIIYIIYIIYSIYLGLIWRTLKIAHVMVLCYGMVLHFDFVEICHDSANQVHLFALAAPDFNI